MCGINGYYNRNRKTISKPILKKMNDKMIYRGPDDEGYYINKNFGMCMRRLSIIDIEGGKQPISNDKKNIFVVLNGEIYNFIELRTKLQNKGYTFSTLSDTEVIIHLYEEYGIEAVNHLNGMFAFALWDNSNHILWIARDRMGIKPLVYYFDKQIMIFSSTLTSIKSHPYLNNELDRDSILSYLALSYVPAPKTIWKNIKKLRPGHSILLRDNKILINRYWKIRPKIVNDWDETYLIDNIEEKFKNSVKIRSRSDVAVGTFLSGGLDSSAVTAYFSKISNKPVHTFSMDFEGKQVKEREFAKLIADKYENIFHYKILKPEKALEELNNLLPFLDEPMADSAIIPTYILSKMAKSLDIKVVLSGAGGDELFGGYSRHYPRKRDLFIKSTPKLPFYIWKIIGKVFGPKIGHYASLTYNQGSSYGIDTSGIRLNTLQELLRVDNDFQTLMTLLCQKFSSIKLLEKKFNFEYSRMITDTQNYLIDNILSITDKASMAASIEARVPIIDYELVEQIFSHLPKPMINKNFNDAKLAFKKSVMNNIPNKILNREKVGFNAPIESWIKIGNPEIKNEIFDLHPIIKNILNQKKLKSIWSNKKLRSFASENIYNIFVLNKWLKFHYS